MRDARAGLRERLLAFVAHPDPSAFDGLAREVVAWQASALPTYGRLVQARGDLPADWRKAPLVPADLFKELDLAWLPPGARPAAVFRSSGTTVGRRSERRVADLGLYHAALYAPFVAAVLEGDATERPWLNLLPDPARAPDSSLSHMVGRLCACLASPGGVRWAYGPTGLEVDAAWGWLEGAARPVVITATSFALLQLLDGAPARRLRLPTGTRMMLTGGFKGRTRELDEAELLARAHDRLGLAPEAVVPEYGMTELTSQAYGRPLGAPPWLALRVVDPLTLRDLPAGQPGLVAFFDLLNLDNVSALVTGDLGALDGAGRLTLLGRAPGAALRGCSLTAEELGIAWTSSG